MKGGARTKKAPQPIRPGQQRAERVPRNLGARLIFAADQSADDPLPPLTLHSALRREPGICWGPTAAMALKRKDLGIEDSLPDKRFRRGKIDTYYRDVNPYSGSPFREKPRGFLGLYTTFSGALMCETQLRVAVCFGPLFDIPIATL